jgi:hypothetical protein
MSELHVSVPYELLRMWYSDNNRVCSNSGVAQMEGTAPNLASNGVQIKLDRLCVGLISLSNATPSLGDDQRPQRRETPKHIPGCWVPQAPRLHEEHDADTFPTFSPSLLPSTHIHLAIYLDDYCTHCQTAPLYGIRGPRAYCLPYRNGIPPIAGCILLLLVHSSGQYSEPS